MCRGSLIYNWLHFTLIFAVSNDALLPGEVNEILFNFSNSLVFFCFLSVNKKYHHQTASVSVTQSTEVVKSLYTLC